MDSTSSEESLQKQAEAAATLVDAQTLSQAIDAYARAHTFRHWIAAGILHDELLPSTVMAEIAERYPDFLEHRRTNGQPGTDLLQDFQEWLVTTLPGNDKPWWTAVLWYGNLDARVQGAYTLAHTPSHSEGSPQRHVTYARWQELAWSADDSTSSSPAIPLQQAVLPSPMHGHYHVGSNGTIQGLREAIAHNKFRRTEGSMWPTARIDRGAARGHAELRPLILDEQPIIPPDELEAWQHDMWRQREELSDLDVDTLDALNAIWLNNVICENQTALASVDLILRMRGVQPKKGGLGTRGGYEPAQRREALKTLGHLQNVWVTMSAAPPPQLAKRGKRPKAIRVTQSRAFIITDRTGQLRFDGYMDVEAFMFRPGDILGHVLFGPGRQTALMSAMALKYNPYTHTWEKRLTRYLSWQWRCRAHQDNYSQPFKIITVLKAVGALSPTSRAIRVRERLEKALDILQADGVITGWQYARWNEDAATKRGWFGVWQQATLLIEPPAIIREHYKSLERSSSRQRAKGLPAAFGERLEQRRKQLGLSQAQAAAQSGISQPYWSLIVKGKKQAEALSPTLRDTLQTWLEAPLPQ